MEATSKEEDGDDISLMSEDVDDANSEPGPSWDSGAGVVVTRWADVDESRLKELAEQIASHAAPASDTPDASLLSNKSITGSASRGVRTTVWNSSFARTSYNGAAEWGEDSTLGSDRTSRAPSMQAPYDPEYHALTAFGQLSWPELLHKLDELRSQVNQHTGQLKSLVKDNFERFISSRDTVHDVAARLRAAKAEGGAGAHGATPAEVADGVARTQDGVKKLFGQLLDRHARGEALERALHLLDRYDVLVSLPSKIRQAAEARNFDAIISLHGDACKAVQTGAPDMQVVWSRLQGEVERAMTAAVHVLVATMESPMSSPSTSASAAVHLTRLGEIGVKCAAKVDAREVFLRAQERAVSSSLSGIRRDGVDCLTRMLGTMDSLVLQQKATTQQLCATTNVEGCCSGGGVGLWQPAEACLLDLSDTFVDWAKDVAAAMHHALVTFSPATQDQERHGWMQCAEETTLRVLDGAYAGACLEIVRLYMGVVIARQRRGVGSLHDGVAVAPVIAALVGAASEQARTLGKGSAASMSEKAISRLQSVAATSARIATEGVHDALCGGAIAVVECSMKVQRSDGGANALHLEPTNFGGRPTVALLRKLLAWGFGELHEVKSERQKLTLLGRGTIDLWKDSPLITLCTAMTTFANALAQHAQTHQGSAAPSNSLLISWSILEDAKISTLSDIATAFDSLLASTCQPAQVIAGLRGCRRDMEEFGDSIVRCWLEQKLSLLDRIMEEFLSIVVTDLSQPDSDDERGSGAIPAAQPSPEAIKAVAQRALAKPPRVPRPVVWSLLVSLASLRSEVASHAPGLRGDILPEALAGVVGGVKELLAAGLLNKAMPGAVCQLWLDLEVVRHAIAVLPEAEGGDAVSGVENLCDIIESELRRVVGGEGVDVARRAIEKAADVQSDKYSGVLGAFRE